MVACVFLVLASALASASAQGSDVDGAHGGYGGHGARGDGAYAGRTPPPSGRLDVQLFKGSKGTVGPDCDCPADVEYVCGSDGNTYDNACMAKCAGVVPVFQGICYHGCMCSSISADPLCLVPEQTTFHNDCLYNCKISEANAFDAFSIPGECTGACVDCPRNYATVCDVSPEGAGNEYVNSCYAECAGVTQWEEGSCDKLDGLVPADCGCSDGSGGVFNVGSGAVCGKDGVTYENACVANCNDVAIAYSGACETDCDNCAARGGPEVCGMDGVTYMNACEARCAPVEVSSALEVPCPDQARGCGCSAEVLEPVCAVSSNTYMNRCFADCVADEVESVGPCEYDSEYFEPMDGYGNPIEVVDGVVVPAEDSEE